MLKFAKRKFLSDVAETCNTSDNTCTNSFTFAIQQFRAISARIFFPLTNFFRPLDVGTSLLMLKIQDNEGLINASVGFVNISKA